MRCRGMLCLTRFLRTLAHLCFLWEGAIENAKPRASFLLVIPILFDGINMLRASKSLDRPV